MNILKTKAWDKHEKEFFQGEYLINGHGEPLVWDNSIELYIHYPLEIIRYTGLKDVKGKEIYEGDIVELPYISPMGDIMKADLPDFKEVGFDKGRFVLIDNPVNTRITKWCKSEKGGYESNLGKPTILHSETFLKVVGNKYENSDLLEADAND